MLKSQKKTTRKPAFLSDDPSDFIFNHSIKAEPSSKPSKKRKSSKKLDEFEDFPTKKANKTSSSTFQDQEAFYSSLQEPDYSTFFLENKADLLNLTRLSGLKYSIGSQVLAAINDKGPNGLYIVVNLSRNKKAFISKEDSPIGFEAFSIGELVIGQIINPKKEGKSTQLTLMPEIINENKREFVINMLIWAILSNEEDHGWTFMLGNGIQAFVRKNKAKIEEEEPIYRKNKPYILRILEKPQKTSSLLICEFAENNQENEDKIIKKSKDQFDIKQCLGPGCLFKTLIAKVLENGLIVKFFGGILGFIYDEHLENPLEKFAINDRLFATILYFDSDNKKIILSAKKNLIELNRLIPNIEIIGKIKEFNIEKKVAGGHFILKEGKTSIFLSKKQAGEIDEKSNIAKINVKIKDFNYLDGLYLATALEEFMQKGLDWKEIKVGDFLNGKIESLKGNKLLISFKKGMKGIVDSLNFSDKPFQGFMNPKFKENKSLKIRVLNIDPINKRLFLTVKPILLQENLNILKDFETIEAGKAYYGYISGKNEYGFIVSFFNNVKGLISFKHLEEIEKIEASSFNIGQTIKVYILFINKEKQKIGLSLIKPEKLDFPMKIQQKKISYERSFEEFMKNLKNPDFFLLNEEIAIGQIYEYSIIKKPEGFPKDFLLLEVDNKEKKHRAIVHKDHLSDIPSQSIRLFAIFDQNIKVSMKFPGILIGKNVNFHIISLKNSLISQYRNYRTFPFSLHEITPKTAYYVYIKMILNKGILINFHENLQGYIPLNKIEGSPQELNIEAFPPNKSLKIKVKSIKNDKILCSGLKTDISRKDHIKEFSYIANFLNEEALILKCLKKQDFSIEKTQIGDFVRAEVTHLKEYGLIVRLIDHQNLIGFIILENLIDSKMEYKKGFILQARVLDIDYETEIVDLKEIRLSEEKFVKLQKKNCYNLKKILKNFATNFKKQGQIFMEARVLLVKDNFAILALKEFKYKVFAIVETRNLNDFEVGEKLEINGIIQEISLENYQQISKIKKLENVNFANKMNFLPIFSISRKNMQLSNKNSEIPLNNEVSSNSLKIGQRIEGKLIKISRNSLIFHINQTEYRGFGKAHFSQFDFDAISHKSHGFSYKIGDKIIGKVLSLSRSSHSHKNQNNFLDLTFLSRHLSLIDNSLDSSLLLPDISSNFIEFLESPDSNRYFPAMVRSLAPNSINPIYFELSNNVYGSISAFTDLIIPQQFEKLNNLSEYFPEKSIHMVKIKGLIEKADQKHKIFKSLQLSLLETSINLENLDSGSLLIVKIAKILDNSLRVQISPSLFVSVDLLEICDEFQKDPLHRFPLNRYLPARVIKKTEDSDKISLSLRESLINEKVWEILTKKGTLAYKKEFQEIEDRGDLRSRVLKLGSNSLKSDMVFLGYVHQTNSKGCFIKIAAETIVRAKLSELSDELLENSELEFYRNKLVIGRIIKIHEDGKLEASLRESIVKFGFPLELETLNEGLIVQGFVEGFDKSDKALIRIKGCRYLGSLNIKDSEYRGKNEEIGLFSQILKKGEKIIAKILNVVKEGKIRIRLGNRKEDLLTGENNDLNPEEKFAALFESIKEINKRKTEIEEEKEEIIAEKNESDEENNIENNENEDIEPLDLEEDGNPESKNEDEDEEEDLLASSSSHSSENEEKALKKGKKKKKAKIEENLIEEEEEEISESLIKPRKKSKKQKDRTFLDSELEIRQQESNLLLSSSKPPENSSDFEKLILQNPHSSYIWISYLAFIMETQGIESARDLANRAISSMNFQSENEKLNVWVASLNLENTFGSDIEFVKVFSRALEANNPKKVFFKTLEIYRRSGKKDLILALANKMIKKHKNSCKAWIEFLRNLMFVKLDDENEMKSNVKRAMQSLEKRKHLRFLSHYARLEFLEGNIEKGRTTFEAMITNYPKRFRDFLILIKDFFS